MIYADLHLHTIYSDGTSLPKQIVVDCATIGLNMIAITDHDITKGYREAKEEAQKWGLRVLTGVEISTTKYHILGYDFDIENKILQELLEYSRMCQEDTTRKRVEKLIATGIPITFEKVRGYFPESRLGKLNIFMTLLKDKECREYHNNRDPEELLKLYLKKGGLAYEVEDKKEVETIEAIQAIHAAGGVAIVAHPFKEAKNIEKLEKLVRKGIDGLEVQPSFGKRNNTFKEYAEKKGMIVTYGSDYHGPRMLERPLLRRAENVVDKFWR